MGQRHVSAWVNMGIETSARSRCEFMRAEPKAKGDA